MYWIFFRYTRIMQENIQKHRIFLYFCSMKKNDTQKIVPYADIQMLREADRKHKNDKRIIAQAGGQEDMLSCNADIIIGGGSRGGSKTFSLLLEPLKDIDNPRFQSVLFRSDIGALNNIIEESPNLYRDFGVYNRAKNDMTWNFNSGGYLKFNYHAGGIDEFKQRFQGHQYAYIGIDEVTHIAYAKFKYLVTCNRNAHGIRNRMWGTCNPDPDSWVATFISWWIGENGLPLPERNGKIRYCFMDGDDVNQIVWGDTREEVFKQCKDTIMKYWREEYEQFGKPEDVFVKSVAFVEAKLADNFQLMRSDPTYLANLAGQSEEQRARDLEGNWKFRSVGDDMLKMQHILDFYENEVQEGDNVRRASCDVAFDGGDRLVMWLWIGNHIQDVFSCRMDAKSTVETIKAKLSEWGVMEENFTYDLNGIGQIVKGFFPNAMPFNNMAAVEPDFKYIYANLKSQAAYMFVEKIINKEYSINPNILERRYSGKGYEDKMLRDILMRERKAIKRAKGREEAGFRLTAKSEMISLIGHSPDFIESLIMHEIFNIKKKKVHRKPKHLPRRVSATFRYR